MTNQANAAARRVIALLRADPTKGAFCVKVPGGYRDVPETVWIEEAAWWVRLSDMMISQDRGRGPLYPGWFMTWRLRRLFRWWRRQDGVHVPPECPHTKQTPITWSQDGYVSLCKLCQRTLYHGD